MLVLRERGDHWPQDCLDGVEVGLRRAAGGSAPVMPEGPRKLTKERDELADENAKLQSEVDINPYLYSKI